MYFFNRLTKIAATEIFSKSGIIYGITQTDNVAIISIFIKIINQTVPNAKHAASPINIEKAVTATLNVLFLLFTNPVIKLIIIIVNINPTMYPPVGPAITAAPALNPENTGTPATPNNIYTIIEISPLLSPSRPAMMNTAKVCKVNGIGPKLILIQEHTTIKAVNTAIKTISCVVKNFFFIISTFVYCFIPKNNIIVF